MVGALEGPRVQYAVNSGKLIRAYYMNRQHALTRWALCTEEVAYL